MLPILNIAAYKFVDLDQLERLRDELRARCVAGALKGTILLAPEGINLFLAGAASAIETFLTALVADSRFAGIDVKRSESADRPFRQLRIKIKPEIVTLGVPGIEPAHRPAPRISARELKAKLDAGEPVILLDTRNQFEVDIGSFREAVSLGLGAFSELPQRAREMPETTRQVTIVTFCTGGIRCEKAAPLLKEMGYRDVRQLDGGILRYFEDCGSAHFDGACFVFDDRIALDARLQPVAPTTTEARTR